MSTDEPAWFTTDAHTARLRPDGTVPAMEGLPEGVEPARTGRFEPDGTIPATFGLPEGIVPAQEARFVPAQEVGRAYPMGVPAQGAEFVPVQEVGRTYSEGVPAQEARSVPAESARLMPVQEAERAYPVGVPAQEAQRISAGVPAEEARPVQPGVPAQEAREARAASEDGTVPGVLKSAGGEVAGTPARSGVAPKAAPRQGTVAGAPSGSAGQGFTVDPQQYLAAVSPLLAASDQVASIFSTLNAMLPSSEAQNPWGNDESGKQFAEGEKGYLKYSHDTMAVLKELSGDLKGIADGLKAMGERYQGVEESFTSQLGGQDPGGAPLGPPPSMPSNPVHVPMTPHITQSGRH